MGWPNEFDADWVWSAKTALPIAMSMWDVSYGSSPDDEFEALSALDEFVTGAFARPSIATVFASTNELDMIDPTVRAHERIVTDLNFLARWAHFGFGHLTTSHRLAAALMASDMTLQGALREIRIPWKAFWVDAPNNLLVAEGHDWCKIHVSLDQPNGTETDLTNVVSLGGFLTGEAGSPFAAETGIRRIVQSDPNAETLLCLNEEKHEMLASSELTRVFELAARLVVGLLVRLQSAPMRPGTRSSASDAQRRGPPPHRVTVVGPPIDLDVRQHVRDYIAHGGAAPAVQTLVRGHYKRQVIGTGRSGRKIVWIQPYWRGPEDAPILSRPYRVT